MPGLDNGNFARSVVYICAHSDAGAMGFIINRPQQITFTDILLHLKLVDSNDAIMLPNRTREFPIHAAARSNPAGVSCCIPMII